MKSAPTHYTYADRQRLAPLRAKVREAMLDKGWLDLRDVAKQLGMERSTVASKLRDLVDSDHAFLGLAYDHRNLGGGKHLYRLHYAQPGQLPLFEGDTHHAEQA